MTSRFKRRLGEVAVYLAPLAVGTVERSAAAQADPPRVDSRSNGATKARAVDPVEPPADAAAFAVVRLPPSAYPEPKVRGIRGGSLWMTFHGLQWPYLPNAGTGTTRIGLSGSGWVDTSYSKLDPIDPNNPADAPTRSWQQQGRLVLRATPTYNAKTWFVQGQAELVANSDQTLNHPAIADTDDLWIRTGQWNKWDVQVGRFEAWELYHFGMGLDINTFERAGATTQFHGAPGIYGVTFGFYRPDGAGNLAVHLYPFEP